jgi:predicted dehydrogenase
MALNLSPEEKATGQANFQRVVGKLAAADQQGPTRRRFMQGLIAAGAAVPISGAAYFGYKNSFFRDRPVRAALIGAGDEGGVLLGEHNPSYVQFVAYSDIRPSNQKRIFEDEKLTNANSPRRGFKHHYGTNAKKEIQLEEDYKKLLERPDIELVVIALPLNLHARVAIEAMRAGKHVLCEKLMAWSIKDCKAMIKAAKETDRLLSIGHQRHYSLLYAHALDVMKSGVLGDVCHIRAQWHRNNATELPASEQTADRKYKDSWRPLIKKEDREALGAKDLRPYGFKDLEQLVRWRLFNETGGGLMAELGSHQLDACSIFLGKQKPLSITAVGGKYFYRDDREIDDHVFCTYEFPGKNYWADEQRTRVADPNSIVAVTYSSINTNDFEPYGECVMGTKGTLLVEQEQAAYLFMKGGRATEVTANTSGGRPVLDTSSSTAPAERTAQQSGQTALGQGPPSRGYREEMEHLAFCIRMRDQGMRRDRDGAELQPRCPGVAAMADAIVALTANKAMRERRRIEFQREWFDPESPRVPEGEQ